MFIFKWFLARQEANGFYYCFLMKYSFETCKLEGSSKIVAFQQNGILCSRVLPSQLCTQCGLLGPRHWNAASSSVFHMQVRSSHAGNRIIHFYCSNRED